MSAQYIEADFPNIRASGYQITSPETSDYNCFAWAAHDTSRWWSPVPVAGYHWPEGLSRNTQLATFRELYRIEGFVPCDHGELESGFEKVVLYVNSNNEVTHAARQLSSGSWTSKLGAMEDIDHRTRDALEGNGEYDYGKVAQFLKRANR